MLIVLQMEGQHVFTHSAVNVVYCMEMVGKFLTISCLTIVEPIVRSIVEYKIFCLNVWVPLLIICMLLATIQYFHALCDSYSKE